MSFESYLDSLGARPANIGQYRTGSEGSQNYPSNATVQWHTYDHPVGAQNTIVDLTGKNSQNKYVPGYVDKEGGFLGYGSSIASLQNQPGLSIGYANYADKEPLRIAQVEALNVANQQAQFDLQQQRAKQRQLASANAPQFGGASAGLIGMGQQGMAPQQFGRAAVPVMGRGAGPGIGRGTGQGLLGGLHRGAAPTGGGQ